MLHVSSSSGPPLPVPSSTLTYCGLTPTARQLKCGQYASYRAPDTKHASHFQIGSSVTPFDIKSHPVILFFKLDLDNDSAHDTGRGIFGNIPLRFFYRPVVSAVQALALPKKSDLENVSRGAISMSVTDSATAQTVTTLTLCSISQPSGTNSAVQALARAASSADRSILQGTITQSELHLSHPCPRRSRVHNDSFLY